MVTLQLLGRINLTNSSGEEIRSLLTRPKCTAVLSFLALHQRGEYLRRDVLLALFWPESDSPRARNALNQTLHALRTALGDGVVDTRGKHDVGIDPNRFRCDVWSFQDALMEGDREGALKTYAGSLMPGFHMNGGGEFDRWLEDKRENLRKRASEAAWAQAHRYLEDGDSGQAELTAHRALEFAPTNETPVTEFITALAQAGNRAAAIRFYEGFRVRLLEDMELEPSPGTQEVFDSIRWRNGQDPSDERAPQIRSTSSENRVESGGSQALEAFPPREREGEEGQGEGRSNPPEEVSNGWDEGRLSVSLQENRSVLGKGRRRLWVVGVGVISAIGLLGRTQAPELSSAPPSDRPFAVLATVDGNGGKEERAAVAFLLRTGLDMSHLIQTVSSPDVDGTLTLMEQDGNGSLDPSTAREVAVRLGSAAVVIPRLDHMGDAYSLSVRLEDPTSGRLRFATRGRTEKVTELVDLVDSAVLDLRRQMGESKTILQQREPLPTVLTRSLEALKEYQLALAAGAGQAPTAVYHLRRAVAADSAFAMAWQLLASFYGNYLNKPDSAQLSREQAQRFRHRLTEARRLDIEMHRRIAGDVALWDLALEEGENAVLRDPRFLNNYAVYLAAPGGLPDSALNLRFRLEREQALNARRFSPGLPYEARCFINTHYLAAALDRTDEFYALLDSLDMVLAPDCGGEVALFESLAAGEWDRVDSLVRYNPGEWRWPTAVETALLQMGPLRGGIRTALEVSSSHHSETKGMRLDSGGFVSIAHLLLRIAYDIPVEEPVGNPSIDHGVPGALAGRGREEVTDFVLYGVEQSLVGDTLEAQRVAGRLKTLRDSATSRTFEGAFEPWFTLLDVGPPVQRGDWPTVLETLDPMVGRIHDPQVGFLPGDDYLLWWLQAEAYIHLGDLESGVRCLESILERPRFRQKNWMLQGLIHPAARFKLAGILTQLGDTEQAELHYRRFLDTFTDPEPEFQWMVEEARTKADGPHLALTAILEPQPGVRSPLRELLTILRSDACHRAESGCGL